jgi:hypothetical protein
MNLLDRLTPNTEMEPSGTRAVRGRGSTWPRYAGKEVTESGGLCAQGRRLPRQIAAADSWGIGAASVRDSPVARQSAEMICRIAGLPCGLLEVEQLVSFRPGDGRKVCQDVVHERRAVT